MYMGVSLCKIYYNTVFKIKILVLFLSINKRTDDIAAVILKSKQLISY